MFFKPTGIGLGCSKKTPKQRGSAYVALIGVALFSGCAIGHPGYLDDYATVGGKWERTDPTSGRVGSVFSDPEAEERFADVTQSVDEVEDQLRQQEPEPLPSQPPQAKSAEYREDTNAGVSLSYYDTPPVP